MTGRESRESELLALLDRLIREVADIATGFDDGFFAAGITSVQLIEILNRLQVDLGRELPITDLFRFPSRRALARRLARVADPAHPIHPSAPIQPNGPPTAQDRRVLRERIRATTGARQGVS